jgi:AcrR family transcriptional regulator
MPNDASSKPMSPRRQRNRERMIQEILSTARSIMRENGAASLTMNELAKRLEIKPPSLYNYFSGLMDIYDALFSLGFVMWRERMAEQEPGIQSWKDEVRRFMESYLAFALENPELYQLCFERPIPGFVPSEQSLQISFGILHQSYTRFKGLLPNIDTNLQPEQVVDLVIAITHGITAQHMANEPHLPLGEGRFGSLIPAAQDILEKAWEKT